MSIVIDIDHEANNLSEYDSTVIDGGDLSASAAAALGGTGYGLSVVMDDTVSIYGVAALTAASIIRLRFYINPVSLSVNGFCHVLYLVQSGTPYAVFANIQMTYTDGTTYLKLQVRNDAGTVVFEDEEVISVASHYVEVLLTAATGESADNASGEWWIDGTSKGSYSAQDVYHKQIDVNFDLRFGAYSPNASMGTVYLDELVVNNDGGLIGPLSSESPQPAYGYATPDVGETATSWTTWHLGVGAAITGDADYGDLSIPFGITCSSPVLDSGDTESKTYTVTCPKYGSNSGTATVQYRGSASTFLWDAETPSWTTYTVPVTQAWQYFQVRLTGA